MLYVLIKNQNFLEGCLKSLLSQTIKSSIIISTSTPNVFIEELGRKYHIPVYVTGRKSDIQDDWNSGYNRATTPLVTIAHQDDVYDRKYTESIIKAYLADKDSLLFYTDYLPIKKNMKGKRDLNSKIKRILRFPLKSHILGRIKFVKVLTLAFGNSICCPTVTYNKKKIGLSPFTSKLKFALDWDTFLKYARQKGGFYYIDKPLVYYRVYDGATTKEFIVNNTRQYDDINVFGQIWPEWMVKIIMHFYKKAYDTYK